MLINATAALCAGFLLDQLLGDPQGWPHIVRGMGALIARLELWLYPMQNKRLAGGLLVVTALLVCTGVPALLLLAAWRVSPWAYLVLESLLCWQCIACKSLKSESRRVYDALLANDLPASRKAVSAIVGRDTDALNRAGVIRAAVETVAENATDGVVAPLFYMALGGGLLGCFYKAVNTMDSMIGYKNDRYLDFGRAAAKLDDAANHIPARLSALLMIAASRLCGLNAKNAARIWKRDRRNHAGPNSAQTEAVMAGALDLQLAGNAYYLGKLVEKPFIGDDTRPIEASDIPHSHRLLTVTAWLALAVALLWKGCVYGAL